MAATSARAHSANMVSQILILLALVATTPDETSRGAQVEIRASATIQRGATLRAEQVTSDISMPPAPSRPSRPCETVDAQKTDCRLIVYDLP
jgi:hypothetical protein